jgi:hypothetical protein
LEVRTSEDFADTGAEPSISFDPGASSYLDLDPAAPDRNETRPSLEHEVAATVPNSGANFRF